jgi:magnesium transporter
VHGSVAPALPGDTATPAAAEKVAVLACRDGSTAEPVDLISVPRLVRDKSTTVWIDLTDPTPETLLHVSRTLRLHPLITEDIAESNERPKVESVGEVIHMVLFALARDAEAHAEEIDFVLGRQFLLSVHPAGWDPHQAHQLKTGMADIMSRGPDRILWALADSVVDGYFPIFDRLADEIDDLQDRILDQPDKETLEKVFAMKRELIRIRHVVAPSREVFNQLTSREYELISEPQVLYFRDIYDHLIRLTDELDSFRDLTATTIEVYLSTVNNNLSAIMKRLTGITVVLAGVGAVGGIFGMSEAGAAFAGQEATGFWIVTAVTVAGAVLTVAILRRIGWL